MCQLRVYTVYGSEEKQVIEAAATIEQTEKGVSIESLFDAPLFLKGATIAKIDFLGGKVLLHQQEKQA